MGKTGVTAMLFHAESAEVVNMKTCPRPTECSNSTGAEVPARDRTVELVAAGLTCNTLRNRVSLNKSSGNERSGRHTEWSGMVGSSGLPTPSASLVLTGCSIAAGSNGIPSSAERSFQAAASTLSPANQIKPLPART